MQLISQVIIQLQRLELSAIRSEAPLHLQHLLRQRLQTFNRQGKQIGPVLITDHQQIRQTAVEQQQARRSLALKKCIGRHRGAEPHLLDQASGDRGCRLWQAKHGPQSIHRWITLLLRLLREHLGHLQNALRRAPHHIGERATTINPKAPASRSHSPPCSARRNLRNPAEFTLPND